MDLLGKVHYVIKENKLNAIEQIHFKTREDCRNFKVYENIVDEDLALKKDSRSSVSS